MHITIDMKYTSPYDDQTSIASGHVDGHKFDASYMGRGLGWAVSIMRGGEVSEAYRAAVRYLNDKYPNG
jgi:hypothetical protein